MSSLQFRSLEAADVEVRVAQCTEKGCSLLLYKDARCDMRLLDDTVGPENWQCDYREVMGRMFCRVGINCEGQWVWKEDCGVPSNQEAEKGQASDAFKRACFKWGIGRELYTAPFIWVPAELVVIKKNRQGKPACYDKFKVSKLVVQDGRIVEVAIANAKTGAQVFPANRRTAQPKAAQQPQQDPLKTAKARLWHALQNYAAVHGGIAQQLLEGVQKRPDARMDDPEWLMDVAEEFEAAA